MKAIFNVRPGIQIETDADKQSELFEQIAAVQEVFGEKECGKCKCKQLNFVVRTDKEENKYYELHCPKCFAKLAFGIHKKGGTIFPKRKDNEEGDITGEPHKWLPDHGWMRWDREQEKLV